MTIEELKTLGIPLPRYEDVDLLYIESAFDWLKSNTTLNFDKNDMETVKALPAGAKLFAVKYRELMLLPVGVTAESVDGLSQTFTSATKQAELLALANELLGDYMKSSISFIPATQKWSDNRWR